MMIIEVVVVDEIMTRPVRAVGADWSLREAAQFLLRHDFTGAPVVNGQAKAVGVLTLKDIARYAEWHLAVEEWTEEMDREKDALRLRQRTSGRSDAPLQIDRLQRATVRQVMTPRITTVSRGTPLQQITSILLDGPVHRIFVADADGKLAGIITTKDIVKYLHGRLSIS